MAGDTERIVDLAISHSQARLDQSLSDFDARDAKAMGVLGADAAALGVVIATHDSLNSLWWLPAMVLSVAGLLLLWNIKPQRYDNGPDVREFFTDFGGADYETASLQMMSELLKALEYNESTVIPLKGKRFNRGFWLFVVGLIGAFLVGVFR